MASTLLYSQSQTIDGVWNGGGSEVYTQGNEHYCFKADAGSSVIFELDADSRSFESCIYLTLGNIVASSCGGDPSLEIQSLNNKMYKVILAPQEPADNEMYTLNVEYEGVFGRCSDYYQAGYLGMSIEDVNFLLALSGLLVVFSLFASIIYVILTLGNF